MVGALLLGFVCGVIARVLMPGDVFRGMSGPTSWAMSLGLGLAGYFLRRRQPPPAPPSRLPSDEGPRPTA
jgi:hypothetical protein